MSNKRYFFYGTVIGLAMIPIVAFVLLGNSAVKLFSRPETLTPVFVGFVSAILFSIIADRKFVIERARFGITLLGSICIYTFSILPALLTNLVINANIFSAPTDLMDDFWDYMVKPGFWLYSVGVPCAMAISLGYFVFFRLLERRK